MIGLVALAVVGVVAAAESLDRRLLPARRRKPDLQEWRTDPTLTVVDLNHALAAAIGKRGFPTFEITTSEKGLKIGDLVHVDDADIDLCSKPYRFPTSARVVAIDDEGSYVQLEGLEGRWIDEDLLELDEYDRWEREGERD